MPIIIEDQKSPFKDDEFSRCKYCHQSIPKNQSLHNHILNNCTKKPIDYDGRTKWEIATDYGFIHQKEGIPNTVMGILRSVAGDWKFFNPKDNTYLIMHPDSSWTHLDNKGNKIRSGGHNYSSANSDNHMKEFKTYLGSKYSTYN